MIFRVRTYRRVRVHLRGADPSVDGFLVGKRPLGGHYRILKPQYVEGADRTFSLEGELSIPKENVLFFQVLGPAE